MTHDSTAAALQAMSDEMDIVGDRLSSIDSKLDQLLKFATDDAKQDREVQKTVGHLADAVADLPRIRERLTHLEMPRHLDAE